MKVRFLTGIVIFLIAVPLLLLGGIYFKSFISLLGFMGIYEFIKVKKKYPLPIRILSYLYIFLFMLSNINNINFILNEKLILSSILIFLLPAIIYQKSDKYTISDALYVLGGTYLIGLSSSMLIILRNNNLYLLIYLVLISFLTDTFAYLGGTFFGKHKLAPYISPKKTIEGSVVGTMFAIFFGTLFYALVIDTNANIYGIQFMSLFLSIMGQLGDLVFSAVKREFKIKDFSNIMPGHGGVLDRIDSLIFIVMAYVLIFI